MIKITKKLFTLLFVGIMLFIFAISIVSVNAYAETDTIQLNEIKRFYIKDLDIKTFYYTPYSNQYYVVETDSSLDTRLRISSASGLYIINDDGGIGNNSRIHFKAESGVTIKIEVKLYEDYFSDETSSGYVQLQIRKQHFTLVSYLDDKNNNYCEDLITPYALFKDNFLCEKYENKKRGDLLYAGHANHLSAINSEIFFYSGHGEADGIVLYVNGKKDESIITVEQGISMDVTRVAVWASCESAGEPKYSQYSLAEYSVYNWGAQSSVGFKKKINNSSSSKFTNKFFEKLAEGATVDAAAKAGAGAVFWAWDAVKSYKVFGNGSLSVLANTYNDGTFSLKPEYDVDTEIIEKELTSGYNEEVLSDNEYRYYELINGYESNNIVDVTKQGGKVINYNDMRNSYDKVLPINDNYLTVSVTEKIKSDNLNYRLLKEDDEHIVYYNFDGIMTPIKISFCTYVNEFGNSILEADCINLYNGERINYSDINGI